MLRWLIILFAMTSPHMANAQWVEAQSNHFVVYSRSTPEEARKFVTELERFDQAVRSLRGIKTPPLNPASRVTVFVLDDTRAVGNLAGNQGVAGFFIPRGSGAVAFVPQRNSRSSHSPGIRSTPSELEAQQVLFHEYAHYLMFSSYPNAVFPAWYVEGFAEFHATAEMADDGSVIFGAAPQYRGYGLQSGNHFPLNRLLAGDRPTDGLSQDAVYGRGWALVHYFQFNPDRAGGLKKYLTEINSGKLVKDSVGAFGDLNELNRNIERHIQSRSYSAMQVKAEAMTLGNITVRSLSEGESSLMATRIRSKRGVTKRDATRIYANAKRAGSFPNDEQAQIALAEAAYDAEAYADAEIAADRAIAADATAIDGWIYKAMSQMARARAAGDKTPATWAAIRNTIGSANRLNPNDPEPLALYYRSFTQIGVAPTDLAKDGMMRAFEIAPYDPNFRLAASYILIEDNNIDMARRLLLPIAYDAHERPTTKLARSAIELLAEKKFAEAREKLWSAARGDDPSDATKKD